MASGAVGGMTAGLIEKIFDQQTDINKALIIGGTGFVAAVMLKMPSFGAGMSGVAAYKLLDSTGLLGDNGDFDEWDYADPIESLPMMLNENGDAMYLQENNNNMDLQENGYGVGLYPSGFGGAGYN